MENDLQGEVGGHSAGRTGALSYIRKGWAIPQVAYLGRWKSDLIYQYAEEALASLPVNPAADTVPPAFTSTLSPQESEAQGLVGTVEGPSYKDVLDLEVQRFRLDSKAAAKELRREIKQLKDQCDRAIEAPLLVKNMKSGLIHANAASTVTTPSYAWRTLCGWRYQAGDYLFLPASNKVSCTKCSAFQSATQAYRTFAVETPAFDLGPTAFFISTWKSAPAGGLVGGCRVVVKEKSRSEFSV